MVEARDRAGAFFALADIVTRTRRLPPDRAVDHLVEAVQAHAGHIDDDAVLVLFERCQVGPDGAGRTHRPEPPAAGRAGGRSGGGGRPGRHRHDCLDSCLPGRAEGPDDR